MKWLTMLLLAVAVLSGTALGQAFTQVTVTAHDAQNNIYQNCSISINFVGQSSQPGPYLLQGSVFQTHYAGVRCDGFGVFSIRLPSNAAIQPQPSAWQFNICDSSGHFCNASGTGIITIAGSTQNITSIMTPLLPILPPPGAEVKSVFGRSGQVVAQTGDYTVAQVLGAAPLSSPVFSGLPQVPTANVGTFNNQAASTAFVMTAVGNALGGGGNTGGGGWNPPQAPGDTIFGNNTVSTTTPTFFIPGGDISFSSGNFSVNNLHFGPTSLALTNQGITSGNCLQVSGSTIIGGACGTGTGGTVHSVFGRIGDVSAALGDYTFPLITGTISSSQLGANLALPGAPTAVTAPVGTNTTQLATTAFVLANAGGTPGGSTLQGCTTPTSGNLVCDVSVQGGTGNVGMLTMPYAGQGLPSPPSTALAAIAPDATGHLFWSPGGGAPFTAIAAGGVTPSAGVETFNGRHGNVLPVAADYAEFFAPIGGTGTADALRFAQTSFGMSPTVPTQGQCLAVSQDTIVGAPCGAPAMGGVTIIE